MSRYPTAAKRLPGIPRTQCPGCGKQSFSSRKEAKTAAKILHPEKTMHAYLCRNSDQTPPPWHYTKMSAARTAAWKDYESGLAR